MFDGADPAAQLHLVGAHSWDAFAEKLRPYFEKMAAGSEGKFESQDIQAAVIKGRFQLWLVLEGDAILCVVLTEIVDYPRRRAMRLIGIVGHRHWRWVHLLVGLEQIAKSHFGCHLMQALHTPGHERMLRTGGWKVWHLLSEKSL